jgi:hypothetical protein
MTKYSKVHILDVGQHRHYRKASPEATWFAMRSVVGMARLSILLALATAIHAVAAVPHAKPFEKAKRQANVTTGSLQVDLGYEIYEGVANSTTKLNIFKG